MEKKFNKMEYDNAYRKKYKKQFNVDLNKDEAKQLDELLKIKNITKVEFLRTAIKKELAEIKKKD